MDTSFQPELQASYYQHKAAKLASYQPVAFDITWNNSIGNQEKYYSGNLGSFDNQGDRLVMQCFNVQYKPEHILQLRPLVNAVHHLHK